MPFNPGVYDRSGEMLAQGISQMGAGMAGGIAKLGENLEKFREQEKLTLKTGKAAKVLLQHPDVLKELGLSPDAINSMSSEDSIAQLTALGELSGFRKSQSQIAESLKRMAFLDQEETRRGREANMQAQLNAFLADIPGVDEQNRPSPEALAQFGAQLGMDPEQVLRNLKVQESLAAMQPDGVAQENVRQRGEENDLARKQLEFRRQQWRKDQDVMPVDYNLANGRGVVGRGGQLIPLREGGTTGTGMDDTLSTAAKPESFEDDKGIQWTRAPGERWKVYRPSAAASGNSLTATSPEPTSAKKPLSFDAFKDWLNKRK